MSAADSAIDADDPALVAAEKLLLDEEASRVDEEARLRDSSSRSPRKRGAPAPPVTPRQRAAKAVPPPSPTVPTPPLPVPPVIKAKKIKKAAASAAASTPATTATPERQVAVMADINAARLALADAINAKKKEDKAKAKVDKTLAEGALSDLSDADRDKLLTELGYVKSDEPVSTDSDDKPKKATSDSGRDIGEPHPDDKELRWNGKAYVSKETYDAQAGKKNWLSGWFSNAGGN